MLAYTHSFCVSLPAVLCTVVSCAGNALPDDISCLAADRMLVFAAHGKTVVAFARNKEVTHSYYQTSHYYNHTNDFHTEQFLSDAIA